MIRDRPDAASLRILASEALERGQHDPIHVARALAIADREAAFGAIIEEHCREALFALFGAGDLDLLWRRLAREIRAGVYDVPGEARKRVHGLLWAVTVQKLRETNPDFLDAAPYMAAQSRMFGHCSQKGST